MTNEQATIAIIIACVAIILIGVTGYLIEKRMGKSKPPTREQIRAAEDARLAEEPEYAELQAEVIDLICGVHSVGHGGHKLPRAEREFRVAFRPADGEPFDLAVSEAVYLCLEVGQSGTLTLVDGELYAFLADEGNDSQ